jgi:hypothetical protein
VSSLSNDFEPKDQAIPRERGRRGPRVTFMGGDRNYSSKEEEDLVVVARQQSNRSLTYTSRTPL